MNNIVVSTTYFNQVDEGGQSTSTGVMQFGLEKIEMRFTVFLLDILIVGTLTVQAQVETQASLEDEISSRQGLIFVGENSPPGLWNSHFAGTRVLFATHSAFDRSILDLLSSEAAQQEIQLSPSQLKILSQARKNLSDGYAGIRSKYPDLRDKTLSQEARKTIQLEMNQEYAELRSKAEEDLKEILVPLQIKQIEQLRFNESVRVYGFSWTVSNAPFQTDVETTKEQRETLAKIKRDTELAIQKKAEEMRKEAKAKMLKVLDQKQRSIVEELEGESAKVPTTRL